MPNSPDRAAPFGISPQKLLALKKLPLLLAVLLGLLAFWTGCANQGSGPDGGPYDETPPHIVSMSAPEKVGRNKKVKFSLTFNELIKVDNPSEKIIVSPPQIEQPEIKVSGRKITVELLDSMIPTRPIRSTSPMPSPTTTKATRWGSTLIFSPRGQRPTPCRCPATFSTPKISNR